MSPAKTKTTKKKKKQQKSTKKAPARKKAPAKKAAAKKKTAKKAPARRKTAKQAAVKKKTVKKAPARKKTVKKAPAKKKIVKKAPAKKKAAAKPAVKTPAPKKPLKKTDAAASKRVAPRRKSRPKKVASHASEILPSRAPITPESKPSGLGERWTCYECGSKFYDLGKEEPLCPKCGADQHDAPKVDPRQRLAPAGPRRRKAERSMAPLLEDDDETATRPAASRESGHEIGLDSVVDAEADDDDSSGDDEENDR